jgi:hypothetical protein
MNSFSKTIDFEDRNKFKDQPNITDAIAYSGKYSCKVNQAYPYSPGFSEKIFQKNKAPRRVYASVECYSLLYEPSSVLVVAIYSKDTCKVYQQKELFETVRQKNNWVRMYADFELPSGIDTSNHLLVFVWNRYGTDSLYLDDLHVRVEY